MNPIIEEIFKALHDAAKTSPLHRLRIRAHPDFVRSVWVEKDDNGHYFVWIDPFDRSKWTVCGLPLLQDEKITGWRVELNDERQTCELFDDLRFAAFTRRSPGGVDD